MDTVATVPVRVKRPREHDSGHVVTGIGYSFRCSCGQRGKIERSYREAMNAGVVHAAMHASDYEPGSITPPPSFPPPAA